MLTLEEKIKETGEFIVHLLESYRKPTLMCSFGKDSMVLLHLLRSSGISVPIVFYTDPCFPKKNKFARQIIEEWGLEVYEYPPVASAMQYKGGVTEVVRTYQVGPATVIVLPKHCIEYQDGDEKLVCGLDDMLLCPKGGIHYPWDVVLIGHKDDDKDPVFGHVKLHVRILKRDEGPHYAYPLKDWTDEDVWEYTRRNGVPMQRDRYDLRFKRELKDKTYNSDYWQGCTRCINRNLAGQMVTCPKTGREIPNVSEKVNVFDWTPDYCGAPSS